MLQPADGTRQQSDRLVIRDELPQDFASIRAVNRAAFGGTAEAQLVDLLRQEGAMIASVVAIIQGDVAGHILFSRVNVITAAREFQAASLAPMSVLPDLQRRGIGSELVRQGLDRCREKGVPFVVVLGHPEFYPRFGFSADAAQGLESPYSEAGPAWMAIELAPGALANVHGRIVYARAFEQVAD